MRAGVSKCRLYIKFQTDVDSYVFFHTLATLTSGSDTMGDFFFLFVKARNLGNGNEGSSDRYGAPWSEKNSPSFVLRSMRRRLAAVLGLLELPRGDALLVFHADG